MFIRVKTNHELNTRNLGNVTKGLWFGVWVMFECFKATKGEIEWVIS